jgi:Dolichyl-phosphate-mannose-protein mannosyltransferase
LRDAGRDQPEAGADDQAGDAGPGQSRPGVSRRAHGDQHADQVAEPGQQHGLHLADLADQEPAEHGHQQSGAHDGSYHRAGSYAAMLRGLALGGILAVYFAFAAAFARFTPAWNNPDEPAHYVYIARIAETGTLPVLEPGDWDPVRLEPLIRSHFPPGTSIDFLRYEAWQPPLYYLVSAPVYRLAPPEARLQALHAFNILLGGASLALTYLVARAFFARVSVLGARESRWFPLLVAGALLGVPMFAATSAAINNDNLANVLGGALTLMLLAAPFSEASYRWAGLFGVLLGLGVLTKLTLAFFVPLGIAALAAGAWRRGEGLDRWSREALVLVGVMLVVMSPWLVRQGLTYGWDDLLAKRRHDAILLGRAFPSFEPTYLLGWGTRLFRSGWALFGWMQVPTAEKVYQLWSAVCQLGLVGLGVYATWSLRVRHAVDVRTVVLAAVVAGAFATVAYYNVTTDVQPQGRFLFVGLGALVTLLALGWAALLPARLRLAGLAALDLALVALNAYTIAAVLRPAFGT